MAPLGLFLLCGTCLMMTSQSHALNETWITKGNKQYTVIEGGAMSFLHAQSVCSSKGGILPQPKDQEENTFLSNMSNKKFYLGMSDVMTEGKWQWVSDRSEVNWFSWMKWSKQRNEPNGGRFENCNVMAGDGWNNLQGHRLDGWVDYPCCWPIPFVVCERDIESPTTYGPTPTTTTSTSTTASTTAVAPTSCAHSPSSPSRQSATLPSGITAVCDTVSDGGGWVIFQRRASADVKFNKTWVDFKNGFGNMSPTGNFWWGLENIYRMCGKPQDKCELRIDVKFNNTNYFAKYSSFVITNESDNYRLKVAGYSGTAGDALLKDYRNGRANGMQFSTSDRDNDNSEYSQCSRNGWGTGWWYNMCYDTHLNGPWNSTAFKWLPLTGSYKSVSFSEMKCRRRP